MASPVPTPWAVICPVHGRVYLTRREYDAGIANPDATWMCTAVVVIHEPTQAVPCCEQSEWDDETFEASEGSAA